MLSYLNITSGKSSGTRVPSNEIFSVAQEYRYYKLHIYLLSIVADGP